MWAGHCCYRASIESAPSPVHLLILFRFISDRSALGEAHF